MTLVNVFESYVPYQNIYLTYHSKMEYFHIVLKKAKVTPVHKSGNSSSLSNYRSISVLPYFSKMLERIMYTRLYNYLHANKIYSKPFGFQTRHYNDTIFAIIQLVDQINENFEELKYALGVLINLAKAFDTIDHKILF